MDASLIHQLQLEPSTLALQASAMVHKLSHSLSATGVCRQTRSLTCCCSSSISSSTRWPVVTLSVHQNAPLIREEQEHPNLTRLRMSILKHFIATVRAICWCP
jgi:hypothetical protein